MHSE